MPSVEANLITYLKTKPAVTGLVGTGDDARIYLEFAKQGVALPYIVIELISGQSFETLSSISGIAAVGCRSIAMGQPRTRHTTWPKQFGLPRCRCTGERLAMVGPAGSPRQKRTTQAAHPHRLGPMIRSSGTAGTTLLRTKNRFHNGVNKWQMQ
jgi:hypothetical protein